MTTTKTLILSAVLTIAAIQVPAQNSLKDVLAKIDATTGKPTDTTTAFKLEGVVSARATLPDGTALAVLSDEVGVPVLIAEPDATKLKSRDQVKLSGKLKGGPLGFAVLAVDAGSVVVAGTNKVVSVEPKAAAALKDASAFAGTYVVVTNVTFDLAEPRFSAGKLATLKDGADEIKVLVGKSIDGRDKPKAPVNLFGVALKFADVGWAVVPARFVPANSSAIRQLVTKHTCFTCHQPDQKIIGPAYRDVAAKYKDDPDAIAKLVDQMEKGGSGKWGLIPMLPFKGKVPPEDMKVIAQWILEMRWDTLLAN